MDAPRDLYEQSIRHSGKDKDEIWQAAMPLFRIRHPRPMNLLRAGMKLLLGNPWFKRVWILQEVAKARTAVVCCGTRSAPAHIFALAQGLLRLQPEPHCKLSWK